MVEYGCNVNNKFGFLSDDEAEDPSVLLAAAEVKKDDKTATQKKAEKKAEKLKKEKEEAARKAAEAKKVAAAAAKPLAGRENRPDGGRGRGRGGPRTGAPRPPREGENFEGRPRGAGRGRGGFRGSRGGHAGEGEERQVTFTEGGEVQQHTEGGFAGRGGRGGFRGERPPRFNEDGTPREFSDRPRGGFRGGRGRGNFDRHSHSDRTGVKAVDAKGGHGKGNWGTEKDDLAAATENAADVSAEEKPEEPAEPVAPREKTAEELALEAIEAEIAKQKTYKEFKAEQKKDEAKFNIRKGGDDDLKQFGKLAPLKKEKIEDESQEEEIIEIVKKDRREKAIVVDFKFADPNRSGGDFRGGRGRDGPRGGRGGARGGPRGGRGGNQGGARYNESFVVKEEAFPALGA